MLIDFPGVTSADSVQNICWAMRSFLSSVCGSYTKGAPRRNEALNLVDNVLRQVSEQIAEMGLEERKECFAILDGERRAIDQVARHVFPKEDAADMFRVEPPQSIMDDVKSALKAHGFTDVEQVGFKFNATKDGHRYYGLLPNPVINIDNKEFSLSYENIKNV